MFGLKSLLKKLKSYLIGFYNKFKTIQIVGFVITVLGIYLVASSVQTINVLCGKCEKGHHLGLLGMVNPVLGLASFAEKHGSKFHNYIIIPLLCGIVLIVAGILLVVLNANKTNPPPPKS